MAATARLLWPGITALHRGEFTQAGRPVVPDRDFRRDSIGMISYRTPIQEQ